MSRKIINSSAKTLKYFTNPLVEGKYEVKPPPKVPSHIVFPAYMTDKEPVFGQYEGEAIIHSAEAIKST